MGTSMLPTIAIMTVAVGVVWSMVVGGVKAYGDKPAIPPAWNATVRGHLVNMFPFAGINTKKKKKKSHKCRWKGRSQFPKQSFSCFVNVLFSSSSSSF